MPRGKDAPTRVGGQIDPYVQRSIQQSKQLAESRLVAAMQEAGAAGRTAMQEAGAAGRTATQEAGATTRTGMQESGAMARAGMQESGATHRAGIQAGAQMKVAASRAESEDKRAAEDERGRREDREYQKTNADANRMLQKAIADQNIELRKAEMSQDVELGEQATNLQLDLATIDIAHKMREGKNTRNMIQSMFKTFKGQEEIKQKKITTYVNAKNETDQVKNVHSLTGTNVGNRLRDDPQMQLDSDLKIGDVEFKDIREAMDKARPLDAIQKQITLEQSKLKIEDALPENIWRVEKYLSQEDLTMTDIRTTWGVIEGAIPVLDERVKEAEDAENKNVAKYWKYQRSQLNQMRVGLQGLMNSKAPVRNQPNSTVGSVTRNALGPILNLDMGSEVNELIKSGIAMDDIPDMLSGSQEPFAPFDIPGLKTKEGRGFLENINNLLMNQGELE